jgi:hypothetical protein
VVLGTQRRIIQRGITFEESDHHFIAGGELHRRFYPRADEVPEPEDNW